MQKHTKIDKLDRFTLDEVEVLERIIEIAEHLEISPEDLIDMIDHLELISSQKVQ